MQAIHLSCDCWTDQRTIWPLMPKTRHGTHNLTTKYNLLQLNNRQTQEEFRSKLTKSLRERNSNKSDVESLWTDIKEKLTSTREEALGEFDANDEEIARLTSEKRERGVIHQEPSQ